MNAFKITTNGKTRLMLKTGLREIQQAVGGYAEAIRVADRRGCFWLYCNEEGKLQDLPVNTLATKLAQEHIGCFDVIVGDCVIMPDDGADDFPEWLKKELINANL